MDLDTALSKLEAAGTAQNRKVYPRHGVREPLFGVSYRDLGLLHKSIGEDDDLAEQLWATGNHDARMLATRVASPARTMMGRLLRWIRAVDNYVLADALAGLVARGPDAVACARAWLHDAREWPSTVAFTVLQRIVAEGAFDDGEQTAILEYIERNVHGMPNRTRYAMLGALIAIGVGNERLRDAAIAAAKRIGPVHVDHGETGCQTPDAVAYIGKVVTYQTERKRGKSGPEAAAKAKAATKPKGATKAKAATTAKGGKKPRGPAAGRQRAKATTTRGKSARSKQGRKAAKAKRPGPARRRAAR